MFKVKEGISIGGKVVTGSGPSAVLTAADVGAGAYSAGITNLAQGTNTTTTVLVTSSNGTTAVLTAATTSLAGILSSTDWNTFNGKQAALVSATNIKTVGGVSLLGSGDVAVASILENKRSVTASTTTTSIDLNNGDKATVYKVTMASNTTITFSNPPAAGAGEVFSFSMMTVNDATAGRTLAFGNTIKWAGGIVPTRTTAANAIDVWSFFIENSVYYGSLSIIDAK
jgi:hypothetical protein